MALVYGLPWLYLHGYFGWQYWRARCPVAPLAQPEAYEQRQAAHRELGFLLRLLLTAACCSLPGGYHIASTARASAQRVRPQAAPLLPGDDELANLAS